MFQFTTGVTTLNRPCAERLLILTVLTKSLTHLMETYAKMYNLILFHN